MSGAATITIIAIINIHRSETPEVLKPVNAALRAAAHGGIEFNLAVARRAAPCRQLPVCRLWFSRGADHRMNPFHVQMFKPFKTLWTESTC